MQVRLKSIYASATLTAGPRQVVDLPEAEAVALIEGGFATPVGAVPAARREKATVEADDLRVPDFLRKKS